MAFGMKIGIVGFAGAGKTTIFNALTGLKAQTGAAGEKRNPHLGVIKVPDKRIDDLGAILKVEKLVHVEITFTDFPPGREERVLDPGGLSQMKEAEALAQVVRCFGPPFAQNPPSPLKEIQEFGAELKLADLAIIESRLARLKKEKDQAHEKELLEKCRTAIEKDMPLRFLSLTEEEEKRLSGFGFLSQKPLLLLLNQPEEDVGKAPPAETEELLTNERLEAIPICGKVEMEVSDLDEKERREFLKELGIMESARDRFVRSCYRLLDLVSFLTHNDEEVRAWSLRKGTSALKAAGKVHSDMERGFIRAEVVHYDDFVRYGSEAKCREAGKLRVEGKEYVVQDGDIIRFRFHV
jgi:GTP-binding protein YchF